MLYVTMTEDIRKFEPKQFGPFTKRQVTAIGISLLLIIPIMFIPISLENRLLIAFLVAAPLVILSNITVWGMRAEVFIIRYIYSRFLTPRERRVVRQNSYREYLNKIIAAEEKKELSKMTDAQRKAYIGKKNSVNYKTKNKNYVFS